MENLTTAYIKTLSRGERYSGLTIRCQGHEFKVHKYILCLQSSVFDDICEKEEGSKENPIVIRINDFPLMTVKRMIEYLYTGWYNVDLTVVDEDEDTETNRNGKPASRLLAHVRMYLIAIRYDIEGLKSSSEYAVQRVLEYLNAPILAEVLDEILDRSPDTWLMDTLKKRITPFVRELVELEEFARTWAAHPKFMFEMMQTYVRQRESEKENLEEQARTNESEICRLTRDLDTYKEQSERDREFADAARLEEMEQAMCLRNAVGLLNRRTRCRNKECRVEYPCEFAARDSNERPPESRYSLKCLRCGKLHNAEDEGWSP